MLIWVHVKQLHAVNQGVLQQWQLHSVLLTKWMFSLVNKLDITLGRIFPTTSIDWTIDWTIDWPIDWTMVHSSLESFRPGLKIPSKIWGLCFKINFIEIYDWWYVVERSNDRSLFGQIFGHYHWRSSWENIGKSVYTDGPDIQISDRSKIVPTCISIV